MECGGGGGGGGGGGVWGAHDSQHEVGGHTMSHTCHKSSSYFERGHTNLAKMLHFFHAARAFGNYKICFMPEEGLATLTLVKKNTTSDIAKMSFRIQLLVTTQRITMARDKGPRAHPEGRVGA